jgi:hypothetical protein
VGFVTAVLSFLGGMAAYRKSYADVQDRNVTALELRVKILENDNENHIREKAALAVKAELHEEDYRKLFREHLQMSRDMERMEQQLADLLRASGQEDLERA